MSPSLETENLKLPLPPPFCILFILSGCPTLGQVKAASAGNSSRLPSFRTFCQAARKMLVYKFMGLSQLTVVPSIRPAGPLPSSSRPPRAFACAFRTVDCGHWTLDSDLGSPVPVSVFAFPAFPLSSFRLCRESALGKTKPVGESSKQGICETNPFPPHPEARHKRLCTRHLYPS